MPPQLVEHIFQNHPERFGSILSHAPFSRCDFDISIGFMKNSYLILVFLNIASLRQISSPTLIFSETVRCFNVVRIGHRQIVENIVQNSDVAKNDAIEIAIQIMNARKVVLC